MELIDFHHQQVGLGWASFLLSELSLCLQLSKLHTSVSAQAGKRVKSVNNIRPTNHICIHAVNVNNLKSKYRFQVEI
jgi:hypothetical protein